MLEKICVNCRFYNSNGGHPNCLNGAPSPYQKEGYGVRFWPEVNSSDSCGKFEPVAWELKLLRNGMPAEPYGVFDSEDKARNVASAMTTDYDGSLSWGWDGFEITHVGPGNGKRW